MRAKFLEHPILKIIILLSFLIISNVLLASEKNEKSDDVKIIYINPDLETYAPITRANLIYSFPCILGMPPLSVVESITSLADRAPYGHFNNSLVRIKVDGVSGGPIYIDARGGLLIEGDGLSKKLSATEFQELKMLFAPLKSPDGCRNLGRWPFEKSTN